MAFLPYPIRHYNYMWAFMKKLLHSRKALFQISDDIVDMLCADGQADGVGVNTLIRQFFGGELAVGGGGRVDDKTLHIGNIGKERENLKGVDKLVGFFLSAFDLECEDGSAAVREVLLIQFVVRVIRQRRMVDLFHLRVVRQELHHFFGVLRMAFQAQGESLNALQQ